MPLFCNLLPFLRLAKLLENVLQTDTHMHCVVFHWLRYFCIVLYSLTCFVFFAVVSFVVLTCYSRLTVVIRVLIYNSVREKLYWKVIELAGMFKMSQLINDVH